MPTQDPPRPTPPATDPRLDRAATACALVGLFGILLALPWVPVLVLLLGLGTGYPAVLGVFALLVVLAVPVTQAVGGMLMLRGSVPAARLTLVVTATATLAAGWIGRAEPVHPFHILTGTGVVLVGLLVHALLPGRVR